MEAAQVEKETECGWSMKMSRVWAMPNADTFDVPDIGAFVKRYLHNSKVSIDPFARNRRWATYTNDLNPQTEADYHMEAAEFLQMLATQGVCGDLAIFDPPYSLEQCARSYKNVGRPVTERDTQIFGRWTEHKHLLANILEPEAIVLSFGWNSAGIGKKHGFEPIELLLVAHGAAHNDTICLAEHRVQPRLLFSERA
jgi:hypothetical protein